MTTYKYVSAANDIVHVIDGDGVSRKSMLASAVPQGAAIIAADPPTAEELKHAQDRADAAAAKADNKLTAFSNMTPAQVRSWIAANVNNLAEAKDAMATLAVAVSILARRL